MRFPFIRRAFTLLELLIVVTILAILAGVVVPYFQAYVEEARVSKAKQELTEIRNALMRFETNQGPYFYNNIDRLVGGYLNKSMADPWGSSYRVSPASSTCFSPGSDRLPSSGDDIVLNFRPPLALSRVFWEDSNGSLAVDTGDKLNVRFTRPIRTSPGDGPTLGPIINDDFVYSGGAPGNPYTGLEYFDYNMSVKITLDFGLNVPFVHGAHTLSVKNNSKIVDGDGVPCKSDFSVVIKARP